MALRKVVRNLSRFSGDSLLPYTVVAGTIIAKAEETIWHTGHTARSVRQRNFNEIMDGARRLTRTPPQKTPNNATKTYDFAQPSRSIYQLTLDNCGVWLP
jgi:hypothetical protein